MSDGAAVPGCELAAPGSSCTPDGGCAAARAAKAHSRVTCTNLRPFHGQTSWELSQFSRYVIPLGCGQYLRRERDQ